MHCNGFEEISRLIFEISLNVLGIVFKKFDWRYNDDNWGNFEKIFDGIDWSRFEDKSNVWRLVSFDRDWTDVNEFDDRLRTTVDWGNFSNRNSLVSCWLTQLITVKSGEQVQNFVDGHCSVVINGNK